MVKKHVKLEDNAKEQLNIAKSNILKAEPQRARVTDNDTIYEALKKFNQEA